MKVPEAETPMMRQFYTLKNEHPDKILFFRMGDFYEMFGEDAVRAAKVLQIALTSRDKNREKAIPMCGVPFHAYEQYLNKLTSAGFKVAICEQMEDPTQAKGIVKRDIVRIVTPGTTVSPQLIHPDRNHYLIAINIKLRRKQLGLALVDVSTGEFEVLEFSLGEMTRVYDFLFQVAPQEILFSQSRSLAESEFLEEFSRQMERLLQKASQPPPAMSFLDPYYFDQDAAEKLLKSHFKTLNLSGFGIAYLKFGIAAAGALLRYLTETQKSDLRHINHIKQHSFENFMLLDETTLSNLEIFESHSGNDQHTLFGVLNQTCTAMGARMLRQWLRQPLLDKDHINRRFDAIEELHNQFILCVELRVQLKRIQDLPRIAGRISLPVAGINDLVGLRESLLPVTEMPEFLKHLQSPLLQEIQQDFDPLQDVLQLLQTQLLEEPAVKLREGNFMADGLSEELDQLRTLSRNSKQFLNALLQKEREQTGLPSLKIGFNKVFGYFLEVSNAHRKNVPEHYIRKQTLVNAERYVTPELKELEEEILGADERICQLEYELFQQLKQLVVTRIARIQKTSFDIASVDVLASLSYVAENNNYVRPSLHSLHAARQLSLQASRHPVIEQIDFEEPFVPNDVELNENDQQIMLITGPNMAGKSTLMRQVALNVLMAQCGSYIPAGSASISIVDRVFTRVGATDKLSQGESTFMVEMNEAAAILNNATDRSLIILDEIGRGTSTFDGISLAWSIVEFLHDQGALTLCATHYHEMTAMAKQLKKVKNFNILIKEEADQIIFMRKVVPGEADKSYGVQVAKLAGLPASVIDRAVIVMENLESVSLESHLPQLIEQSPPATPKSVSPPDSSSPERQVKESSVVYNAPIFEQLSLFADESPFLQELRRLDLDEMTPLQSLTYLHDLVKRLNS